MRSFIPSGKPDVSMSCDSRINESPMTLVSTESMYELE
jgi:hypothetical protein